MKEFRRFDKRFRREIKAENLKNRRERNMEMCSDAGVYRVQLSDFGGKCVCVFFLVHGGN